MGEAAALLSAFVWSAVSVAMASIAARVSPLAISTLRLATGSVLLFVFLAISGQAGEIASAPASAIFAMLGSGLLAYALGDTIYIRSLGLLGVQRAFTVAQSLFVTLTVLGGVLLLDEPFGLPQVIGTACIAMGIGLIVRRPGAKVADAMAAPVPAVVHANVVARLRHPESGELRGYLFIAVTGVFWTVATLWLAAGRGDLGPIAAASMRTPAGAAGLLLFAGVTAPEALRMPFRDKRNIGAIVVTGIVGTAFGSLMYVYAVGEAGAARTTILSSVSPLMALPLSVFFLGERLTPRVVAGTLACVLGILFVVA
ncbi:MAG: DMT family transporter [Dehalococcoidia bacterium]|nr:DMT family transporter [Dehalococcoidia bacterium]